MLFSKRPNRRWAVPAVALLGVVGVGAVPSLINTAGASVPNLPVLTPAELLAKARTTQVPALSGTVTLTSNLGLPSLGSLGGLAGGSANTITTLLAGTHSAQVWIDGADHVRIATSAPLAETNWIRNGTDLWSYDSATQRVLHATIAADAHDSSTVSATSAPDPAHETPAEFAKELLDEVTPSTGVTVDANRIVAGRAAYQLTLTPNSDVSTVKAVTIAVDAATGLPLDVTIRAASTGDVALEFGFSDVSFNAPAASTFAFTPPPGSTVKEAGDPSALLDPAQGNARHRRRSGPDASGSAVVTPGDTTSTMAKPQIVGQDWSSIAVVAKGSVPAQVNGLLSAAPRITAGTLSGRLLSTNLFNAVFLDDGRVVIGALTPSALEGAIAALPQ